VTPSLPYLGYLTTGNFIALVSDRRSGPLLAALEYRLIFPPRQYLSAILPKKEA
jgi:hypothetical protein